MVISYCGKNIVCFCIDTVHNLAHFSVSMVTSFQEYLPTSWHFDFYNSNFSVTKYFVNHESVTFLCP
jgi:hypothetical protein